MSDETIGEVVRKTEAAGTYTHLSADGRVWHLEYIGSVEIPDGLLSGFYPFAI